MSPEEAESEMEDISRRLDEPLFNASRALADGFGSCELFASISDRVDFELWTDRQKQATLNYLFVELACRIALDIQNERGLK